MRYNTILFDFDHTLFDSDRSEEAAFEAVLTMAGVEDALRYLPSYQQINKRLWSEVEQGSRDADSVAQLRFERLAEKDHMDIDPVSASNYFRTAMGDHGRLYPGAWEVLEELTALATLALVTNGIGPIQRSRIERCGISRFFEAIVISGEVGASKPSRQIFEITFDQLGNPSKDGAVMIGDSLTSDIRGGADFGLDTVWYNRNGAVAGSGDRVTHEIAALEQLIPLLSTAPLPRP